MTGRSHPGTRQSELVDPIAESAGGPPGASEDPPAVDRARLGRLTAALPERRALVRLVLAQLLIGIAIGLVWLSSAPTSVSYMLDTGQGGVIVPAESEAQVAADGRYMVLTVLAGLTFGLLAWRLRGNRGPLMLPVLAVSSLLSSLLAMATGQLLSTGRRSAPLNTAFHPPLVLHASAAIFLQALLAVLVYTVFVGLSGDQDLGRTAGQPVEPADQPAQGPDPTR
jgi:hypothetical protein